MHAVTIDAMNRLRADGVPVAEIADQFGISVSYAYQITAFEPVAEPPSVIDQVAALFAPGPYCGLCGLRNGRWCTSHDDLAMNGASA